VLLIGTRPQCGILWNPPLWRVAIVVIFVLVAIFFAAVLLFIFFVWLFSKEGMDSRKIRVKIFRTYFAHAQWYASQVSGRGEAPRLEA